MSDAIVHDRMTVTLDEAVDLAVGSPENRFLFRGPPGIGKSSMEKMLRERTGYYTKLVDCANMDIGDAAIPMPVNETKTLEYYLNSILGLHTGEPVCLILDELLKAPTIVFNMFHPLLETHQPRMGNRLLPDGSIIVILSNLGTDGVGDNMLAHSQMRVTEVEVRPYTHKEWLPWAAQNNIHPVMMAWVDRTPECGACYRDGGQENNPYIFLPNKVQGAVFTWRTAERCSYLIHNRHKYSANALLVAMSGAVGKAAANSIAAFIKHHDSQTPWIEIMEHPLTAAIPSNQGALAVMVFGALQRVQNKDELTAFLTYIERTAPEWQCTFCISLAKDKKRSGMAFTCKKFAEWCANNQDLL